MILLEKSRRKLENIGNRNPDGTFRAGVPGIGGRPRGSLDRWTKLKDGLAEVIEKKNGLAKLAKMLDDKPVEFWRLAIQLFPKEDRLRHEIAQLVIHKNIEVTCSKCGHHNTIQHDTGPSPRERTSDNIGPRKGPMG